MSYNPEPEWATVKLNPRFIDIVCPHCRFTMFKELKRAFDNVMTAGYYSPAYIPPTLDCTCENCEEGVSIPIRVEVHCERW